MKSPGNILVFQTAFPGDVILTLPMVQMLRSRLPNVVIDVVTIPAAAAAIENHPDISTIIVYDKRESQKGVGGASSLIVRLRKGKYDAAIIPHRSLRSASICYLAGIPRRIGFSTSAGRLLLTDVVPYDKNIHEVARNLSLLQPLGIDPAEKELPRLYPSATDSTVVDTFLSGVEDQDRMIAIAPGSVWATKRWLPERFAELASNLSRQGFSIVLIGGKEDLSLAASMMAMLQTVRVIDAVGQLTMLQSAEVIRRCKVLITNDSAPMHLAVSMRTPVVAIFGATIPEFGFAPLGEHDEVVQILGLTCRPCGIHGGNTCPIKTFDCMNNITAGDVFSRVQKIVSKMHAEVA